MSQDQLGLFDTPPNRTQVRLALLLVGLLVVVSIAVLSALPDVLMREIDAFVPMVDTAMFLGDLITATLLYVHAAVFRSRALTALASGYLFNALMLIAHLLSFPGAFAPAGLLGPGLSTTAWIGNAWRVGIPVAVILYVLLRQSDATARPGAERPAAPIAAGVLAAIALAAAMTTLATVGQDLLLEIFVDRYRLNLPNVFKVNLAVIALQVVATFVLFRHRRSVLDLWLLVALAGWLTHALQNAQAWARFTLSFYSQFSILLFSNLIVMLALMTETHRLYLRLAITTAARERERETRLMSMDAMAAAISHEVGQPLSAVITNATGGLHWLARERPDTERVKQALLATVDAGKRATDVIKSIRALFAREAGTLTELDLNALVRETVALLDRELAGEKVSLHLKLDAALPPVFADRVQMQQVLVNLLINAIESLRVAGQRTRRITIRSASLDDHNVLVEISDNGVGIAPEELVRMFQAFFTTKATGTGLGLSLCRTIVEEHGGSLRAFPGEEHGATFHLRLPRSGLDAR